DRIVPLTRWTEKLFPEMNTARVVPWAGLRPMTPSMMPRVGAGKMPGVFFNTGHGHLGWTLSCATAEMVTQSVQATLPVSASPFFATASGERIENSTMPAELAGMSNGLQP
nr:FAD-dependent oxidoreductase [Pseudomonas sp.]